MLIVQKCVHNANNFLELLKKKLNTDELQLDELYQKLSSINTMIKTSKADNEINKIQKLNTIQKESIDKLLQIPKLILTCIQNKLYDEALDLHDFLLDLIHRYHNIKLLIDLYNQVISHISYMKQNLLQQLSRSIQLTQCLQLFSYLRRINKQEILLKKKKNIKKINHLLPSFF